ncbi:cell division control protein 45 homolog isoform X3 [Amphibalanus amphitrite]|uniref:cell division control protein 45 homolog isoform X3 n=1 Tax=Amphibalanus amphitrite TaxID=1232801 RepID=UPI001C9270EB|nr:cell division control protein 45 homolog isoform X3 [Amphibalanus amphitrite]
MQAVVWLCISQGISMLINDIKKDFYQQLLDQRILLLVHCDVDAICTSAILQELFRGDHVLYTLIPIKGPDDLRQSFKDNVGLVRLVVLINCGISMDLVAELDPPDDVIIFVIDSQRPMDVNNVYNDGQVRIVTPVTAEDGVPPFSDLYRSDDSDSDSDAGESESGGEKRRRYDAAFLARRQDRRRWEERRDRLLAEYSQFSMYGDCSALLAYDLALRMSRDTSQLLWYGLVGLTEQLLLRKVEHQRYVLSAGHYQGQVARYGHQRDETTSADCLRLAFEQDLNLVLYRHWSLFDSLRFTPLVACQFKLFTFKGEKRLQEFLAELGLPLVQCRQKFASMDMALRGQVRDLIQAKAEKYLLDGVLYGAFQARLGFRQPLAAADVVHAMVALLENPDPHRSADDCFMDALSALDRRQEPLLRRGIGLAEKLAQVTCATVQSLLDMHQVISVGAFLYATVSDGEPNSHFFARPHCLTALAHFVLRAHVAGERSKRSRQLPLILTTPLGRDGGACLVVGVPPLSEQSPRNLFGKAFEKAAQRIRANITPRSFDGSVVEVQVDDRTRFVDALVSLLA